MKRLPYEAAVSATDTPRILAVDDVRLAAVPAAADAVEAFYTSLIGLDRVEFQSPKRQQGSTPLDRVEFESPNRQQGSTPRAINHHSPETCIAFRGWPRSGPHLIVKLVEEPPERPPRRQVLLQVGSLFQLADAFEERRVAFEWSRGWHYYDRRMTAIDPGGNRVEVVASHRL